jgi:hypothetical protein
VQNMDLNLIGALAAAVAALAGTVTWMGRWFLSQFDSVRAEVIECRRDRENLWKDRDRLWERIADLSDKIDTQNGGA